VFGVRICGLTAKVLGSDFFLVACRDEFIENARLFIFETYCRIHNTISIRFGLPNVLFARYDEMSH
jgi:hypothetical protein